jgi:hypothetical protein
MNCAIDANHRNVRLFFVAGAIEYASDKTLRFVSRCMVGCRGSELDPTYATCNLGKEQSPIDIRSAEKAPLPTLGFDSRIGPLKYSLNNGYTIHDVRPPQPLDGRVVQETQQLDFWDYHDALIEVSTSR